MAIPRFSYNGLYLWTGLDPLRVQWSPRASRGLQGEETGMDPRRQASPLMLRPELCVRPTPKALKGIGKRLGDTVKTGMRGPVPNIDFVRGVPGAHPLDRFLAGGTPRDVHPALTNWRIERLIDRRPLPPKSVFRMLVIDAPLDDEDHIMVLWRLLLEKSTFFGGKIELCSLPYGWADQDAPTAIEYLYSKNEKLFRGEDPKCSYLVNLSVGPGGALADTLVGILDLTAKAVAAYQTGNPAIFAEATLVKRGLKTTGLGFVPNVVEGVRALDSLDLTKMSPDGARFAAFGSLSADFVQALSGVGFDQAAEAASEIIPAPNALVFAAELVGDPMLREQFFALSRDVGGNDFVQAAVGNYVRLVDPGLAGTRDAQELIQAVKRQPLQVPNSLLAAPPRVPVATEPLTLSPGLVARIREETAYHMVMDARQGFQADLNDAFARAYAQVLGFPPMAFHDPIMMRSGVNGVDMEKFSRDAIRRAREFFPGLPEPRVDQKEEYPEYLQALAQQLRAKPSITSNLQVRDDIRLGPQALVEDIHRYLGTSFPELSSIPRLREVREAQEEGGLNPYILGIGGVMGAWLLWRRLSGKT